MMRFNKITIILILSCMFVIYLLHKRKTEKTVNLSTLLKNAIRAAELGGQAIVKTRTNLTVKRKGLTKEGMADEVTSADYRSHCVMVQTITSQFPILKVISEESDTSCSYSNEINDINVELPVEEFEDEWVQANDVTVWIDPLDATHEFTEKLYQYVTTMVCVALNGRPVIGVIHKPFQNITSWAWIGKAKSLDLQDLPKVDNKKMRISISRSHSGKIKEILDKKVENYEIVMAAGAGYKSLQVAYGEVNAYLHITAIKKWDICAGNAILEALGGRMTDKQENKIDYSRNTNLVNENGLIATLRDHSMFSDILQ